MIRKVLRNARSLTRPIVAISLVVLFTVQNSLSQVPNVAPLSEKQSLLLIDLQNLAAQATNLTNNLARARANAEIADSLWRLDEQSAKELLREAYKLTFPDPVPDASPARSGSKKSFSFPTSVESARRELRNRVLLVASRDKAFASSLIKLHKDDMDSSSAHIDNAMLAKQAFGDNDIEAGSKYLIDALHADPTQTMAGFLIRDLAKRDRAAADKLIIEYLGILRGVSLSSSEERFRVFLVVLQLIFPSLTPDKTAPAPGPEVMRAYSLYILDTLSAWEQVSPGSLSRYRTLLVTVWAPINQYAPDLIPYFMRLDAISRSSRDTGPIPTLQDIVDASKKSQNKQLEQNLELEKPDPMVIEAAVRNGEFNKARKAIDRMEESDIKDQLLDLINAREAIALTSKGRIDNAELLALKLRGAVRIIEAYSALIAKSDKPAQKISLGYRALEQLRRASNQPENSPMMPAGLGPTGKEIDPKLSSLSKLFLITVPLDDDLAKSVLQETTMAMNRTDVDSSQGRLGFDPTLFKEATAKNQLQAEQAAASISDPLRRIVALAAMDKWKIDNLNKERSTKNAAAAK
jgi:pentatricopeptide repeat protein